MMRPGRVGAVSAVVFSVAVCLVGLWWTVRALSEAKGVSDSAAVLALLPSLVGVVLGA